MSTTKRVSVLIAFLLGAASGANVATFNANAESLGIRAAVDVLVSSCLFALVTLAGVAACIGVLAAGAVVFLAALGQLKALARRDDPTPEEFADFRAERRGGPLFIIRAEATMELDYPSDSEQQAAKLAGTKAMQAMADNMGGLPPSRIRFELLRTRGQ